jgi:hypothetical protein
MKHSTTLNPARWNLSARTHSFPRRPKGGVFYPPPYLSQRVWARTRVKGRSSDHPSMHNGVISVDEVSSTNKSKLYDYALFPYVGRCGRTGYRLVVIVLGHNVHFSSPISTSSFQHRHLGIPQPSTFPKELWINHFFIFPSYNCIWTILFYYIRWQNKFSYAFVKRCSNIWLRSKTCYKSRCI